MRVTLSIPGTRPFQASALLFKIVPDDFVEPARNTAMPSAVVFKTASKAHKRYRYMDQHRGFQAVVRTLRPQRS